MAKKDKFAEMQQSGGATSFQDMLHTVQTVAAIQSQQEEKMAQQIVHPAGNNYGVSQSPMMPPQANAYQAPPQFIRLPNPQIPVNEYNIVSAYCNQHTNMTRKDYVELAILEKLHNDKQVDDNYFNVRYYEIRHRPSRGQRKGYMDIEQRVTSNQLNSSSSN